MKKLSFKEIRLQAFALKVILIENPNDWNIRIWKLFLLLKLFLLKCRGFIFFKIEQNKPK